MFSMIDFATLPMTLAFLCAYACPAIALRQTVHARIDTATRKRPRSDPATEEDSETATEEDSTDMHAEGSEEERDRKRPRT
jgi:hypothetical protein